MGEQCSFFDENKEAEIEYIQIKKMKGEVKKFKLNYGELKHIVDALEDFKMELENSMDHQESIYNKFQLKSKLDKTIAVAEKIKNEIGYCENCRKKEKEETGYDGISAAVKGIK